MESSHKRKAKFVHENPSHNENVHKKESSKVGGGFKTAIEKPPYITLESGSDAISRSRTPPVVPVALRKAAGFCCGEMFVTANARRWTFFCSFCTKSTRDIGEFICHIKAKHLPPSATIEAGKCQDVDDDPEYSGVCMDDGEYDDNEQSVNLDTSYLDYGNFLDVNVHTESEDLTFNGQEKRKSKKMQRLQQEKQNVTLKRGRPTDNEMSAGNETSYKKQRTCLKAEESTSITTKDISKSSIGSNASKKRIKSIKDSNSVGSFKKAGSNDNDVNDTEHMKPLSPHPSNHHVGDGGDVEDDDNDDAEEGGDNGEEDDDEQDYDNKLLIALADSLDNMAYDGSGYNDSSKVKEKRRQIRGTAYCELCDKTFQYYSLYRNHMIKHSNETPFKCTICHKGFKSKQAIRYHINTHTKEKLYKCGVCRASYNVENHYITHVLSHENATTFPCIVCGKILRSETERYQHLSQHTEERPYRCEFCNKLFRLRHHLSNHLKLHRQYRCDFCKEDFTSDTQLRKPYTCNTCTEKNGTGSGGSHKSNAIVHPLELYDSEQMMEQQPPPPPIECVNVAEIFSDSEVEDINDSRRHQRHSRQPTNNETDEDDDEEEEDDDEDEDDDDDDENDGDGDYVGADNDGGIGVAGNMQIYGNNDHNNDNDDDGDDDDDHNDGTEKDDNDECYTPIIGKRFECKECERSYSTAGGLSFHIKQKHNV